MSKEHRERVLELALQIGNNAKALEGGSAFAYEPGPPSIVDGLAAPKASDEVPTYVAVGSPLKFKLSKGDAEELAAYCEQDEDRPCQADYWKARALRAEAELDRLERCEACHGTGVISRSDPEDDEECPSCQVADNGVLVAVAEAAEKLVMANDNELRPASESIRPDIAWRDVRRAVRAWKAWKTTSGGADR